MNIKKVEIKSDPMCETFIQDIQRLMGVYADPIDEVREVVEKNRGKAVAFEALVDGERIGLSYIIPTPYDKFQPRYHLAYIAVDQKMRGNNVGKLLFQKVLAETGGDFSLHVSPKNQDAVKFYEKMGMKKKYLRMTMK